MPLQAISTRSRKLSRFRLEIYHWKTYRVSQKKSHSVLKLKCVVEVRFYFSLCVSESEFQARSIWAYFRYPELQVPQTLKTQDFLSTYLKWSLINCVVLREGGTSPGFWVLKSAIISSISSDLFEICNCQKSPLWSRVLCSHHIQAREAVTRVTGGTQA